MRVLVLGGYGLVGSAIVRRLLSDGHDVTGLGRDAAKGRRLIPGASWVSCNIASRQTTEDWSDLLTNMEVVVNAVGALQSTRRDDVTAVQLTAIKALINTCEIHGASKFVQISAPMADTGAKTEFMSTKGAADAALRASSLRWTILRPGLVIASSVYGGSSLIRMLAALPVIGLIALADRPIQSVHVDDVAEAVSLAIRDDTKAGLSADLVEETPHTLTQLVTDYRRWLGFPAFRTVLRFPNFLMPPVTALADLAGQLGWRSPLRRNAVSVLDEGVTGNAEETRSFLARPALDLTSSLNRTPATLQDRWHARLALLFPLIIAGLSLFWLISGLIGIWQFRAATAHMSGLPVPLPALLVMGGIGLDLLIAAGLLVRQWIKHAVFAGIAVTLAYLGTASFLAPDLWADPLGPLVKSATLILLHLVLLAMLEER